MEWLQKLRPALPVLAAEEPAPPVDLQRGLATLFFAFACFGAATMSIIASLRVAAAVWLVPGFLVAGMLFLCVQPNAQMTLRRIPRALFSPAAVPVAAAVVLIILALTVLGTWALWVALAIGLVWGVAKLVLWVARARAQHEA